jgi:hypothetical protein
VLELREKNSELMESIKHNKSVSSPVHQKSVFSRSSEQHKTRMDASQKRLVRARTKENNFDDSLRTVMDMNLSNTFKNLGSINQYLKKY